MIAALITALGVGLLNGFLHCSGMCGPFVLAFSMTIPKEGTALGRALRIIGLHNAGRILGFTILGALFGMVGSFVNMASKTAGLDGLAGIVGGALMIVWAVDQARTGHGGARLERWSIMSVGSVGQWMKVLRNRGTSLSSFLSGLLLSIHPCGLLFALLLTAAATGSWWHGGLTLVVFGIGTIPAMVSVALAGFYGRKRLTGRWASYATAILIGLSGILFALRGLAVNGIIPEVNPWLF
jgi:hypothetical protein